jgi:hypothetical protein
MDVFGWLGTGIRFDKKRFREDFELFQPAHTQKVFYFHFIFHLLKMKSQSKVLESSFFLFIAFHYWIMASIHIFPVYIFMVF